MTELFHATDTKKNKEHNKPIIILNVANQWDNLLKLLEPLELADLYHVVETPEEIIEYMNENIQIIENQIYIKEKTKKR